MKFIDLIVWPQVATKRANHLKSPETIENHSKPPETIRNNPSKTFRSHWNPPTTSLELHCLVRSSSHPYKTSRYYQNYPKTEKGGNEEILSPC